MNRNDSNNQKSSLKAKKLLAIIGPGILIAATGVGAGDLATAAFTGGALGLTVLWAVVVGAFFKFVVNEGLARWQLATGSTLLEGCVKHFGKPVRWLFLAYLLIWSFLVAAALMGAVGVTCHAIYPLFGPDEVQTNKIFYGILHSALAVILVKAGGYPLFEKVMSVCIGVMFVVVVLTAALLRPPPGDFLSGLFWPVIPAGGAAWTVALIGGVGGTLTVLCYGYWIREEGREGIEELTTCRVDLASGYVMTAVFGVAMVVIGSALGPMQGGGATLVVDIAQKLEVTLGVAGPQLKWAFLVGAWGAVFSSLLGVWQSVPYLFADLWGLMRHGERQPVDATSMPYQAYLLGIAAAPIIGLAFVEFQTMQKTYAIVGALFVPLLALSLLILNRRIEWVGPRGKNSLFISIALVATLLFFVFAGAWGVYNKWFGN